MRNLYTLSLVLITSLSSLWGQEVVREYAGLDTVQLQVSRIPMRIEETGRNVSVVTAEQLANLPFTSLDELLQYVPGMEVQSRNAFGAQGDISLRGATFTQVMVLIDGMKLNDPLTSHFNSYMPVAPDEIERIEILRGAAAASFGADAVGGVINIVTKGFTRNSPSGTQGSAQLQYGENALVMARQGFSYQGDKLFVGGGINIAQSDGVSIAEREIEGTTLERYDNFFDIKTMGLAAAYDINDQWSIRGRTAYDHRDFSARYFYTTSPFDKSVETTRNWWNQLQLSRLTSTQRTDVNLVYKRNTDLFVFSPDFPSTNSHITQFFNSQLSHFQEFNEALSLEAGIQVDYRSIESNDRGDHEDWHTGIYGLAAYRAGALSVTGSLRLDYDENYDGEFSPMLNAAYQLSLGVLRASVGRSIRAADYTERYVSFNLDNLTPGRNLGNPDLMAEQGWSQELGMDVLLTSNWTLKFTGFLRQSSNLIDFVPTNEQEIPFNERLQDSASYFFARNITDVETKGVEIESWYTRTWGNGNRIQWSLGYTFLETTNEEGIISVYISSHARHLITTQALLRAGKFTGGINGVYKVRDERVAPAIGAEVAARYGLWNGRLGYQITPRLGLTVQVHNLFDVTYQDILGAPMPGRWSMGGLNVRF